MGLIKSPILKASTSPNKYKKAMYAIRNVSKKKIIRKFENCPMKVMIRRGPNMSLLTVTFT